MAKPNGTKKEGNGNRNGKGGRNNIQVVIGALSDALCPKCNDVVNTEMQGENRVFGPHKINAGACPGVGDSVPVLVAVPLKSRFPEPPSRVTLGANRLGL